MKCKYCEKELMEGAKFCVYCGKPVEVEEPKIIKPEQKEEIVQPSTTIADPFAILEQKKNEIENQPTMPQMPEVPVAPKTESTPVQPELETKIPSVPVKDPFEALDQNVAEKTVPEINPSGEVTPVESEIQTQPLEQVKEEITNVTVKPKVEVQKETSSEPMSVQSEVTSQPEPTPIELPKEPEKQEINIETKIVKKNNPILIIIIFVLLAIIIGGGIFVYTKYIAPSNNKSTSNTVTTNKEVTSKIKDYDKLKAKELIDTYYFTDSSPSKNLFTEEITTSQKKSITVKNITDSEFQTITCEEIDNFSKDNDGVCRNTDDSSITTDGKVISYDALNKKYKYLFGEKEEIEKQDFEVLLTTWKYDSAKDSFIVYNKVGGFVSGPYFSTYGIQSAKVNGENLTIDVGYIFLKPTDPVKIAGEEISFTETEIQKEGFEKEFLDKYLDKLDTYEFTFKYENDHYIFVDMKKI